MLNAAAPSGSYCPELLGISDLFGSGLLPALSAGFLSSGSFRPVAAHGNNPARPLFCPHSTAGRSEAVFRWSPTHFRYVDCCCATVGVATQSRRLLVNSHLGANDVLIVLSANRVINKPILCLGNHIPHLLHHFRQRRRHDKCRRSFGQLSRSVHCRQVRPPEYPC